MADKEKIQQECVKEALKRIALKMLKLHQEMKQFEASEATRNMLEHHDYGSKRHEYYGLWQAMEFFQEQFALGTEITEILNQCNRRPI